MRRSLLALLAVAALIVAILPSGVIAQPAERTAGNDPAKFSADGVYIVQMADDPVVAYDGSIKGLKATAPGAGQKIDPRGAAVGSYSAYLDAKHADALARVGGAKLYDYHYVFNGFAARLTGAQATKMSALSGVLAVEPDRIGHVETATTPHFLGLDQVGTGLWDQLGGVERAGEGVIIGVIDTGIWPEHPSFSDAAWGTPKGKSGSVRAVPGWYGVCQAGEGFTADDCNQKLIGARFYPEGFGLDRIADRDFLSPRDWNGHGSHTSSTAAGNNGVVATGDAAAFGTISGMAPRAQIAMYKVCWESEGEGGCATSDSIAAIDQAVADGVDVINYSISGTSTNYLDAVEVSFLFAAKAGVFVAASAGNSGPTASTVAHISPWLTSVAASTHDRSGAGSVTLGNGVTYTGASVAAAVGPAPLVDSVDVGLVGADSGQVELCYPGTLDSTQVTGRIVICKRGVIARVDKSAAVKAAGGVGMVMYNDPDSSLNADFHFVPTVHVDMASGLAIKAYVAADPAPTATINQATIIAGVVAPSVAPFSSRGPSRAGGGDILKPDLMAPGVDILAAVAPPGNHDRLFDLLSGTSMSSPHVAGLAALLKDLHPNWSPMAIKSALMTSATQIRNNGSPIPGDAFGYGAGFVQPNSAADPGLVYEAGWNDWRGFLRGQGLCTYCGGNSPAKTIDASDLNQASIAIGDLAGTQTVTRKIHNVGASVATYTASVSGLSGITVSVVPSTLTLTTGASATFQVTFTRTSATLNAYSQGALTWSDGTHSVRSPLVIRPVAIAAPAEKSGSGPSGSTTWSVTTGYAGTFTADARGLIPAATQLGTVVDDPTDSFSPVGPGVTAHTVVIPAGTTYARFSLFDDYVDGLTDDLDLYVYRGSTLVGASGGGTAAEEVNLVNPAADTYTVYVHGWQTDGPDANYTLFSWALGSTAAGNMAVTASSSTATVGGSIGVTATWTGLSTATKYLGAVAYGDGSSTLGTTIVRVDVP